MKSREALNEIKDWVEYITRLDYVDPIVRGEVKQILFDAYHKTTPEFEIIEKDLEVLEIIKNKLVYPLAVMSLPYELYNNSVIKEQQLTQKEYDKIKEWLKND